MKSMVAPLAGNSYSLTSSNLPIPSGIQMNSLFSFSQPMEHSAADNLSERKKTVAIQMYDYDDDEEYNLQQQTSQIVNNSYADVEEIDLHITAYNSVAGSDNPEPSKSNAQSIQEMHSDLKKALEKMVKPSERYKPNRIMNNSLPEVDTDGIYTVECFQDFNNQARLDITPTEIDDDAITSESIEKSTRLTVTGKNKKHYIIRLESMFITVAIISMVLLLMVVFLDPKPGSILIRLLLSIPYRILCFMPWLFLLQRKVMREKFSRRINELRGAWF